MSFAYDLAPFCKDAACGQPQRLQELLADTDEFLREINVPKDSHFTFEVEGVVFQARLTPQKRGIELVLWAALGYLPYTVTDPVKRKNLIEILEGARYLPTARLGIDGHMRILVKGTYGLPSNPPPDFLFMPLLRLLQEARPYIALIGENL